MVVYKPELRKPISFLISYLSQAYIILEVDLIYISCCCSYFVEMYNAKSVMKFFFIIALAVMTHGEHPSLLFFFKLLYRVVKYLPVVHYFFFKLQLMAILYFLGLINKFLLTTRVYHIKLELKM